MREKGEKFIIYFFCVPVAQSHFFIFNEFNMTKKILYYVENYEVVVSIRAEKFFFMILIHNELQIKNGK